VSPSQIGWDRGFYDYAEGTDGSAVTDADSAFARLEREFPLYRAAIAASDFANWQEHKHFLLEFMQMLRARSPLGLQHCELSARSILAARVVGVNEDRRTVTVDSLEMRPLPEPAVRNFTVSTMLQDVAAGAGWATQLDWCLRYTTNENEGFCTTDQSIFAEGPLPSTDLHGRMSPDMLRHPDTLVFFPLCWQACLFGSPLQFDTAYDRADPRDIHALRAKQKRYADRFLVSPIPF
jgi:hypothetical protein